MEELANKRMSNQNKRMRTSVVIDKTEFMKTPNLAVHDLPDPDLMKIIKQEPKRLKEFSPIASDALGVLFLRHDDELKQGIYWAINDERYYEGVNERKES